MGIVVFGALGFYVIIFLVCVALAATAAKKRQRNPWLWGSIAALGAYLIVFWDHIPTVLLHKYYCGKEAGMFIHKTAERWRAENPGVAESLRPQKSSRTTRVGDNTNYVDSYMLNERLKMVAKRSGPFFLHRWRHELDLVDVKTDEVLGASIDFSTGYGPAEQGRDGDLLVILKFWLFEPSCADRDSKDRRFFQFKNTFPGVQK